ncbi:AAA family ATPase [Tepidicella baoligensis]|uniref:bifunctional aminoglycoside phosphotransferase/ATP-binding protein n=1 Tax=Tepidicella baoligensis TaxID=2707016 RepID=UPI0015DA685B|nr:bifunctional aminoglycoside phosphotransferase/ATP-binding protein [Tepidicella baoligensis]
MNRTEAAATGPAGEEPPAPHRVIETHISRVLLAGPWAYKVKKPLKLSFLDFSTVQRRRHFCEEEWRINRRTAPELYVDVLPLSVPWHVFEADPEAALAQSRADRALDWVVRMRRFDAGALLAERWARGELTPGLIDRLAAHVAAFHGALPPVPADAPPAKPTPLWVRDSLNAIRQHPGRPAAVSTDRVDAVGERLLGEFSGLQDWMAARHAQGWVRECHGDLHLGNLIEWQGRVMAFDAIEFDADLRRIDVINDAAFTFMDLFAHDEPALAWRFVSGYLDGTGDHDGLRGLRPYAAYRALVRAHVALLGSGGAEAFGRYWRCLETLVEPPPAPGLWLMMGVSGSGKSTVAGLLRDALAAHGRPVVRVRSDVERKRLLGVAPTARPTPAQAAHWYSADLTRQTYDRLMAAAQSAWAAGCSVVLDAASLRRAERLQMRTLAATAGVPFHLWVCHAPQALMAERLVERERHGSDPSDAGLAVMERQRAWMEPVTADEKAEARLLHNEGDLAALDAQVQALLRQDLGG